MKEKIAAEQYLPPSAFPSPPKRSQRVAKDFGLGRASSRLPIASAKTVNREMLTLVAKHRRGFYVVAALQLITAGCALVSPRIFGNLLGKLSSDPAHAHIVRAMLIAGSALIVQTLFAYWTRVKASILGEFVLSSLRERFLERVVELPPNVVERAGSGELLSRTTTDIDHTYSGRYEMQSRSSQFAWSHLPVSWWRLVLQRQFSSPRYSLGCH